MMFVIEIFVCFVRVIFCCNFLWMICKVRFIGMDVNNVMILNDIMILFFVIGWFLMCWVNIILLVIEYFFFSNGDRMEIKCLDIL